MNRLQSMKIHNSSGFWSFIFIHSFQIVSNNCLCPDLLPFHQLFFDSLIFPKFSDFLPTVEWWGGGGYTFSSLEERRGSYAVENRNSQKGNPCRLLIHAEFHLLCSNLEKHTRRKAHFQGQNGNPVHISSPSPPRTIDAESWFLNML